MLSLLLLLLLLLLLSLLSSHYKPPRSLYPVCILLTFA